MKKRILSLALTLGLVMTLCPTALAAGKGLSNFQKSAAYTAGTFTDVPASTWYTENVKTAYELGLMKGTSSVAFSPDGNITVGSAIALACRLHSIYETGGANFIQGNPWYQVYVDYAVKNGIITQGQYTNYDAAATRRQFAAILAKALPAQALEKKNTVEDGTIPDLDPGSANYDDIYLLYRAGVLTGSDSKGTFQPETTIGRSSVAAIVSRMALPTLRQSITLKAVPVTQLTMSKTTLSLEAGKTATLSVTAAPADATTKTVTWKSSNTNIATVDSNGKVTGKAVGEATITVTTADGGKTATCKVTVSKGSVTTITYSVAVDKTLTLDRSDFYNVCAGVYGNGLDYVKFDKNSSKGTLYYQYDKSGEKKVTSSTSYYRSSSPRLYDVTFVPAKEYTGNVELSFTGRSTDGDSFNGTVVISYSAPKEASVIRYSTGSAPVTFSSADFVNACASRGAGSLTSVKFEVAPTAAGKLYYGYTGPNSYGGLVSPSISFPASGGSGSISAVTFVPKAAYNGTVTLSYTGTDSKNNTFTGKVEITVTPTTGSRFTDMGNYSWAAASVDFLYDGGVTTGTSATTYGPALNITRGDFILMLYRAFNLSANTTDGFKDVPSDSYYAQAIAVAKALGIAQGSDDGRFNPTAPLTREDAMVFLYRTLNRTGRTIASASASYLNRFSDGSSTSSYAQDSVAALAQAGIIQGDTNGRLNPKGSLTRAEMAVILHRVVTL